MVKFGKNGTDANSAAIRLARYYTKQNHIGICGYHGGKIGIYHQQILMEEFLIQLKNSLILLN